MPTPSRHEPDLPAWMASGWTVVRQGPRTAVVRRGFTGVFREAGLIRAADAPPRELSSGARPFRPGGGRGALALVPAGDAGPAVVRPYRRGGLPSTLLESRYLLGDRAFHELETIVRLHRDGVPTVEPLAAVQAACRPGYRAALVTRLAADARPAPEVLAAPGPAGPGPGPGRPESAGDAGSAGDPDGPPAGDAAVRDALRRMGRTARRLHDAGGHHPDLNAHNFLLPDDPGRPALLLDFDRARRLPVAVPAPLARWSLRRLRRSLEKLGLEAALARWEAFEQGYGGPGGRRGEGSG